jgi:hypothetical protein
MSRIIKNSYSAIEAEERKLTDAGSIPSGSFTSVDAGKYDGTADKQNNKPMFAILTWKKEGADHHATGIISTLKPVVGNGKAVSGIFCQLTDNVRNELKKPANANRSFLVEAKESTSKKVFCSVVELN